MRESTLRLVIGSAILVLAAAVFIGTCNPRFGLRSGTFEPRSWIADTDGLQQGRMAMLPDLMSRNLLIGLDAAAVRALLGDGMTPARVGTVDTQPALGCWDLVFPAGCADTAGAWLDPFSVDCNYLCLKWSGDGRVCAIGWVRD